MITFRDSGFRALRQARRAIHRGEVDAAFRWVIIANRLIDAAQRISDLEGYKHRRRPLPPRPEPAPAEPASARKPERKTEPSPVAAPPKPFCPHSKHPSACFCKKDSPA